jgi:hypothetical protein
MLVLADRMRRGASGPQLAPDGHLFSTRQYLADAACWEWPLTGRHFSKLYFGFWPGTASSIEPLLLTDPNLPESTVSFTAS